MDVCGFWSSISPSLCFSLCWCAIDSSLFPSIIALPISVSLCFRLPGSSFGCTDLMYIWSHLCLLVSLCPFIFSLLLPLFSLISSALSAPLLLLIFLLSSFFSSNVYCWSTFGLPLLSLPSFSLCFSRSLLSSSHPQSTVLLFLVDIPLFSFLCSCSLQLTLPSGLNDLEMLRSLIWICSQLEAHSEPQRKCQLNAVSRNGSDEATSSDMWKPDGHRLIDVSAHNNLDAT